MSESSVEVESGIRSKRESREAIQLLDPTLGLLFAIGNLTLPLFFSKRKQREEQRLAIAKRQKKEAIEKYAIQLLECQSIKTSHKENYGKFMEIFKTAQVTMPWLTMDMIKGKAKRMKAKQVAEVAAMVVAAAKRGSRGASERKYQRSK